MEQIKVYIDFEAIANPFAKLINIPNSTPYCYSLGLLNDKNKFQISTFIIDFRKHNSVTSIWAKLKKQIILDINKINKKVNIKNVVFVGHNPYLEIECLKKMFPDNSVEPLINNSTVSLSKLVGKEYNKNYFSKVKEVIFSDKNNHKSFFIKALGDRNGAIASYIGYWLYVDAFIMAFKEKDRRIRFFCPMDRRVTLRELRSYSNDDVDKMLYLASKPELLEKLLKELSYKKDLLKAINNLDLNDKLTIKEIKEKIWSL
ncbi:DUF2779 domain-containing protein [Mycoplasma struthionis]|uniref:DUF2779 domain-containing protein n=1 Tax=Mycoplasma struthionis TaxID=538220 RepID=A0A3G8LG41_9MOLU|nr:DUF2779 domain-containing protein [Mycoplasma struthionis]AZG68424.1 DUF2779 domain-containing protein [Mycoplasma struthionis]TPI02955.1 DUF2779 domain-containing protein [Mycoplasma struthionis]